MTYKLLKNPFTNQVDKISFTQGNNQIIFGTDNPDSSAYQQYLKWLSEGNEPLPADE